MIAQIANFITWHFNPNLISEPITIRWYGAMFAIGFIAGAAIIAKMFKHEGEKAAGSTRCLSSLSSAQSSAHASGTYFSMLGTIIRNIPSKS